MMQNTLNNRSNKWWHYLLPLFVLILIAQIYFSPLLSGKVIQQGDMVKNEGMSHELKKYYEDTGETAIWTGAMFSGMPAYHVGIFGMNATNYLKYIAQPLNIFDYMSMSPFVLAIITFYVMMLLLGANIWVASVGAIAFAFSSYNPIIIEAGHVTKMWAIAWMPLVVAGVWYTYRKQILLGASISAVALSLQIGSNHYQVTFYLGIIVVGLMLSFLLESIKEKSLKRFFIVSASLLLALCFALLSNASGLYPNYELGKESIRGKSELTPAATNSEPVSSGLDKDYAFAWSYGKAETFSLLIPNIHGGSSGGLLSTSSETYRLMKKNGMQVGKEGVRFYTYWGAQPFTSGPIYFGAIVCFLFVLGLFVSNNKLKWWLLGLTVFSIMLSWGKNLEWFNDIFFYHLPFYNKFRTPSMALVIAQFVMPMLAIITLKEVFEKSISRERLFKGLKYALGIIGGICLILAVMPSMFFDFTSSADAGYQLPTAYYNALMADRKSLLSADAWRALCFVLLTAGVIYLYQRGVLKKSVYAVVAIGILMLVDMWQVDKRYLNDKHFIKPKAKQQNFALTPADNFILKDTSLSYRVLTLENPFNNSYVSYHHKSIGGYHPAKQRRYQELIEHYISPEMSRFSARASKANGDKEMQRILQDLRVLNMLNMRYVIYDKNAAPIVNRQAYGNAWFAKGFQLVESADEEMAQLQNINPRAMALVDKRFEEMLSVSLSDLPDDRDTVFLTQYKPDELQYYSSCSSARVAVFSEVYYAHGWKAYIDGEFVPHFRTNWILRGMIVPAGEHTIEFRFEPDDFLLSVRISRIASAILLLLLGVGIVIGVKKRGLDLLAK
ncbi:MAG: hypothetical protein ACRC3G_07320 [Bacteroidales bacterium]